MCIVYGGRIFQSHFWRDHRVLCDNALGGACAVLRGFFGLGAAQDRRRVRSLYLASDTLPFAERLNSGVVAGALTLDEDIEAVDLGGSQRAALEKIAGANNKAPVKISALVARSDCLQLPADFCAMCCPVGRASGDAVHNKRDHGSAVPSGANGGRFCQAG